MIYVYTLNSCEKWDRIVKSFKNFDVYWLSGYVKAFKIHGDGEPLLFYYENGSGIRGINVVMRRDISDCPFFKDHIENKQLYDFTSPYGYGGWLIESSKEERIEDLFNEYLMWCQDNSIVSEFVRFHPVVKNHCYCDGFYNVTSLGKVVSMDISTREIIWNNLTSKNRNMIRKAIKNDIHIYNARTPEAFDEFIYIYNQTMDRDKASNYYYFENKFYRSILDDLEQNAHVFYAVKDNKTIASSIIIGAQGKLNYHLSGSLREYGNLAPTNLLLYKAALWGCENGYKSFFLGGGVGSEEDSLFLFKKAFYRGELDLFCTGKKIFMEKEYFDLVNKRNCTITSKGFFPLYRAH